MKYNTEDYLLLGMLFITICLGWVLHMAYLNIQEVGYFRVMDNNMTDLQSDVYELQYNFTSWYSYNSSNIKKDLTESKLKEQGGVCWHASDWYIKRLKNLGYNTASVYIQINKTMGHEFTVASDTFGNLCVLDQSRVLCWN
jgi:hypothetical protein